MYATKTVTDTLTKDYTQLKKKSFFFFFDKATQEEIMVEISQ